MSNHPQPSLGLALSGGGNRSTFYIGFLEALAEANLKIDHIAACSGGSLVAAAFACGTLPEFKELALNLTKEQMKTYFTRGSGGGLYSLDLLEEEIRRFTKGFKFEEVRPLMSFVAVDIENGEKVVLSMGDIAKAARISCTLPGIFEPVKWGGKTLIDGGLLSIVPGDILKRANVDVSVGVNMRGTKHIFTSKQIAAKRVFNFLKKILLVDELEEILGYLLKSEDHELGHNPRIFSVLGKSLDLAILANKFNAEFEETCDLTITPHIPKLKRNDLTPEYLKYFYQVGRETAVVHLPQIKKLMQAKTFELSRIKTHG